MAVILQMSFKMSPEHLGENLVEHAKSLAKSITKEPGFIAKIWTEDVLAGEAGGIYLFENSHYANAYLTMHKKRMSESGASDIDAKIFDISTPLTKITKGPLTYFD